MRHFLLLYVLALVAAVGFIMAGTAIGFSAVPHPNSPNFGAAKKEPVTQTVVCWSTYTLNEDGKLVPVTVCRKV